mgnify:FL=1
MGKIVDFSASFIFYNIYNKLIYSIINLKPILELW